MSFRLRLLGSAHSHFGSFASLFPTRRNSRIGCVRSSAHPILFFSSQLTLAFSRTASAWARCPCRITVAVEFKFHSVSAKKQDRHKVCLVFLAEKERFELSRRLYPTYTLSRGASSANLSTSPYLRIAVFQIRSTIIPHFPRFVNIFFSLFSFFRFLFALSLRFYSFFIEFLSRYSLAVSPF